jgi:class 3 adenylate cyclase
MATLDHFHRRATQLLSQGSPLSAYDAALAGLQEYPGDPPLQRLMALSLARTGASQQAGQILAALVAGGHHDEETIGMLARTFKDLWAASRDPQQSRRHLEQALKWYSEAHRLSGGYWSGINAATMALLLGDRGRAETLAAEVRDGCLAHRAASPKPNDEYWLTATLGEAALILGDTAAAAAWYREAIAAHQHGVGDMVATRRNARLILRSRQADGAEIEACFRIPKVAVFAGHLIDRPDRAHPRFPEHLQEDVRGALLEILRRRGIGVGFASAGSGGDILFLECLHELGADSQIVLPYSREQFIADSVSYAPGWDSRFDAVLARAAQVVTASEQRMPGNAMSYSYGFLRLDGAAALRADELETELVCIAVWDGAAGDGPGGTAESIEHWQRADRDLEVVDLAAIAKASRGPAGASAPRAPAPAAATVEPGFEARIVGILFADVAGFSRLAEEQIPVFVERYLGEIGRVIGGCDEPPILTNTWGDGLYFVFRTVQDAGVFALRLSEALRAADWPSHGLPASLGIRIAAHAGPAYECVDPVTHRLNFLGAHVSFAARIEPITPPGVVYGSAAFAALARSAGVEAFVCGYVGPVPLAKGAGTTPMYVVQRRPG